ncbi:hypothetical protein ACFVJ5_07225 [Nocardia sp. NPDC127606]
MAIILNRESAIPYGECFNAGIDDFNCGSSSSSDCLNSQSDIRTQDAMPG